MSIPFRPDPEPVTGVLQQRTPLVARVLCGNPGPFTYTGTGTHLVGQDSLAVIDPGPDDPAHGTALLAAIGRRPVSHILVTHTHSDHSPLSRWLGERTGAPVLAFGPHGTGRKSGIPGMDTAVTVEAGADTGFRPDGRLSDGDTVAGDGWCLDVVHTPGHTANHLCFHLVEENLLFTGDHVMGWSTSVIAPPDGDMRDYMASLDRLIALAPATLVPTHGAMIEDPLPCLHALKAHRQAREDQIIAQLAAGRDTIPPMVDVLYTDIPEAVKPAAALSILAHMAALVDDGRVAVTAPETGARTGPKSDGTADAAGGMSALSARYRLLDGPR